MMLEKNITNYVDAPRFSMGHRLQNTTQKMTFISLGLLQNMVNQQHELTRKVCYFNFA